MTDGYELNTNKSFSFWFGITLNDGHSGSLPLRPMTLLCTQAPPLRGFDWADQGQQTRDEGDQVTEYPHMHNCC